MNQLLRLLIIGLIFPFSIFAQADIDLGVYLGLSSHGSDLNSWGRHGQGVLENPQLGYGLHLGYGIKDQLKLKLQYKSTQIEGNDVNLKDKDEWGPNHERRGYAYRSSLSEIGLQLEYQFTGLFKKNISKSKEDSKFLNSRTNKFTPFVFGGFSLAFLSDDENFRSWGNIPNGKEQDVQLDQLEGSAGGLQIPVGLGFKYFITSNIYADIFYSGRLPISDYLDGISEAGNPNANDSYQFCGFNLGFYLNGNKVDSDGDGIADDEDECPKIAGVRTLFGCPDADLDGIMDKHDNCPQVPGPAKTFGCPDTDGDGIIDKEDKCPNQRDLKTNQGCPVGVKIP